MTREALYGQMMQLPLQVSSLITHAARHHGGQQIISRLADGTLHRYTYAECERRARGLALALAGRGIEPGDRVATLAFNSYRHLELYYAISGSGAVCHTINPRLFFDQIVFIVNDARDRLVFFDPNVLPLVEKLAPVCPLVERWVCLCAPDERPASTLDVDTYESLLAEGEGPYAWPELDERLASSLCYTSGTTGNPKGVLYSHRSTLLHSLIACLPDAKHLEAQSVVLPIVPMFHANAWGLPYAAPLVGARLVLPGPRLDPASLYELLESEQVTTSAAVPTVWVGLLDYLATGGRRLHHLQRALIGGSAVPLSMVQALAAHGVEVRQAWGMTETSPIVTASALLGKHAQCTSEQRHRLAATQGRSLFGVDIKLCDDAGTELPWDGESMGQLLVRGHWVASAYFQHSAPLADGWLPTGDIATIDPDGYVEIRDRAKDLIKSGGEWISSIDVESIACAHPAVRQAACIACPHPKWGERPLLLVVLKPDQSLSAQELRSFFEGRIARWAIPEDVVFLESLPLTATGKLNKLALREQFAAHRWPHS